MLALSVRPAFWDFWTQNVSKVAMTRRQVDDLAPQRRGEGGCKMPMPGIWMFPDSIQMT